MNVMYSTFLKQPAVGSPQVNVQSSRHSRSLLSTVFSQVLRETGEVIEDGSKRIFVNTVNDDGTDIADLMSCFTRKQVNNPKFPVFSAEVKDLKQSEGGTLAMCKVMEYYENIAREEERRLIAEEMKRKDFALAQKDSTIANQQAELAALRAQLAALTQRA